MLGIIGGVGPAAGADLLMKITEETKAIRDQEHLPVILFSLPGKICDRTDFLQGKTTSNPGIEIGRIAVIMERLGVTVAAIACHTAYAPEIFNEVSVQLSGNKCSLKMLNLIDENINYLKLHFSKSTRIGVLTTTGVYEQKLFFSKIEAAGFKAIIPTPDAQQEVHQSIYHPQYGIKSCNGKVSSYAKQILNDTVDILKKDGAEAIILGCTELPLALKGENYNNIFLIDSTRILARAMIREYDATKLKKEI